MKSNQAGFTLIELLVALAITGFIGLVASQLISTGFRAQLSVKQEAHRLENSARVWLRVESDFSQIIDRSIIDEQGNREYALTLENEQLTFTRSGWANPLNDERSQYQRVSYRLGDTGLIRRFWRVLDRSSESKPIEQTFLGVSLFEIEVLTPQGEWITRWPKDKSQKVVNAPQNDNQAEVATAKSALPIAIKVTMASDKKAEVERVFEVISYDKTNTTNTTSTEKDYDDE